MLVASAKTTSDLHDRKQSIGFFGITKGHRNQVRSKELLQKILGGAILAAVSDKIRSYIGDTWENIPGTLYNSAWIRETTSDSRHHLFACEHYYNQRRFSYVKLCEPIVTPNFKCQYAKCILFIQIGYEQLVILKLFPFVNFEDREQSPSVFRDTNIGSLIIEEYTLLRAVSETEEDFDDCFQVLKLCEIERQEQFVFLNYNLAIVNHFIWSNIFTSAE